MLRLYIVVFGDHAKAPLRGIQIRNRQKNEQRSAFYAKPKFRVASDVGELLDKRCRMRDIGLPTSMQSSGNAE